MTTLRHWLRIWLPIAATLALLLAGCAWSLVPGAEPQSGLSLQTQASTPAPEIQETQERQYRLGCSQHGGYIDESALAENRRINAALGGDAFWLFGVCRVDYEDWSGWYSYPVSIDAAGAWDASQADTAYTVCELAWEQAAESAQDGYPWATQAVYHDDTGVCVGGDSG